jgi:SAM-dependent methyltransferase
VVKLHLACGGVHLDGYINVDVSATTKKDFHWDLFRFPYPWETSSVDEIQCHHFVEHIPHHIHGVEGDGLIRFMEECYRILKPGASMHIRHPHPLSDGAWADPTHTRLISPTSWQYFNKEWREMAVGGVYDYKCDFEMVDLGCSLFCPETTALEERLRLLEHVPNSVDQCMAHIRATK